VYTSKAYRGFESHPIRHIPKSPAPRGLLLLGIWRTGWFREHARGLVRAGSSEEEHFARPKGRGAANPTPSNFQPAPNKKGSPKGAFLFCFAAKPYARSLAVSVLAVTPTKVATRVISFASTRWLPLVSAVAVSDAFGMIPLVAPAVEPQK